MVAKFIILYKGFRLGGLRKYNSVGMLLEIPLGPALNRALISNLITRLMVIFVSN